VVGPLSKMLLKLYVLRQPMLSRSTTDCLEMLCSSKNSHLGSAALGELLQQVLQQEAAWDRKDTDLMLALTSLIESGFTR
jgi:ribosomal RNA-processing protein 12